MMKAKYYSTSELAQKTGTSRQVISAIINEKWKEKRISQATYDRVREAMDDLGFVPDRTAISLKKDRRKKVGVICHGPLYSHILTAIEKLNHHFLEQHISVEMNMSSEGGLADGFRDLMGQRVESIIILLSPMTLNFGEVDLKDPTLLNLIRAVPCIIYNFPFGVHDQSLEDELARGGSRLIGFSKEKAYEEFFKSFQDPQESRILIDDKIFSLLKLDSQVEKLFKKFGRINTYPNPQVNSLDKNPFIIGEKLAGHLLSIIKEKRYNFVLTSSDRIAQGMAKALKGSGFLIPDEINILGFDNIDDRPYFKHSLPTIEVPIQSMIAELLSLLNTPKSKNAKFLVDAKLMYA